MERDRPGEERESTVEKEELDGGDGPGGCSPEQGRQERAARAVGEKQN
jgi:hypothetical protein